MGNRDVNEDSIRGAEKNGRYCFIVADGLGGHGRGDEASCIVSDEIIRLFNSYDGELKDFIGPAIDKAQEKLMDEQIVRGGRFQMKTTVVVLVIEGSNAYWGFVGDSRLYYFKNSKMKKRTIDHSVPQMLVLAKNIKEKEIRHHPDRNKLLRVLGIEWDKPMYELDSVKLKNKQAFLLCTDGFWELITEDKMEEYLKKSETVAQWLEKMADDVKSNGVGLNMDNYSAVAVVI